MGLKGVGSSVGAHSSATPVTCCGRLLTLPEAWIGENAECVEEGAGDERLTLVRDLTPLAGERHPLLVRRSSYQHISESTLHINYRSLMVLGDLTYRFAVRPQS